MKAEHLLVHLRDAVRITSLEAPVHINIHSSEGDHITAEVLSIRAEAGEIVVEMEGAFEKPLDQRSRQLIDFAETVLQMLIDGTNLEDITAEAIIYLNLLTDDLHRPPTQD